MRKSRFLGAAVLLGLMPVLASAQSVIINEFSQGNGGNKEWIEALVVAGPVDMRGWGFTDGTNALATAAQLSNDTLWSAVPTGTLIVIYNGADVDTGLVEDTDIADRKLIVAHNNTTLMVAGRSFQAFGNTTSTDNARLLDSTGAVVHDWDQSDSAAFTAATLRPGANQAVQYNGNTAAGVADAANWSRILASAVTPGQPNGIGSANETWINSLRGVSAQDPNISAPTTTVQFPRIAPNTTVDVNIVVTNAGAAQVLNVAGSTIGGTNQAAFSIQAQPTGIAPGGTGNLTVRFNPAGVAGVYTASLTINSNDSGGDTIIVPLVGSAADVTPYAGLYITEAVSQPTADEFIEIQNTSGSTIDISGVILSDEDNSNTEGAVRFPAGTSIAPGEVIVVATNDSTTAPSWLGTVPTGLRVFFDPIRNGASWTAPGGVTLIAMEDYTVALGGTNGVIALPADDGAALYHPLTVFNALYGASSPGMALDGFNYNNTVTTPIAPINSTGAFDTQATRVGTAEPVSGSSIKRLTATVNSASNVTFEISAGITPGVAPFGSFTNVASWTVYE